jgi:hypothetical protein
LFSINGPASARVSDPETGVPQLPAVAFGGKGLFVVQKLPEDVPRRLSALFEFPLT